MIVLITFLRSKSSAITHSKTIKFNQILAVLVLVFTIVYMGFRPISGRYFGDMGMYAHSFGRYQMGRPLELTGDVFFNTFMKFCSAIMTVEMFFLVCTLLYVLPLWLACKKWFKEYHFYAFLALVTSFSFWAYGTNGIRNGIATSVFLFAISRDKMLYKVLFLMLAFGVHKSILIPTVALGLTYFYADPKKYFFAWLLCIPVSLVSGSFWEGLFAGLIEDDRTSYLTAGNVNGDNFSSTGFRWDFLIYSASAVYCAFFFIFKKEFQDKKYNQLVCVYLIANAFWILVIRANFSNRFAYLSWFLMGIVIVYPFLTKIQLKNQHRILGLVLLAYFGFTFLMNVILAK
ncbi:MAG TPA: EpsG family protein [Flavobacterium sp.]|nr:EpsG family protein [Flavobacterium sp.]